MGAQCFKSIEVIAIKDIETYLVPKILEELKFKIIPIVINQLQMTEDNINVPENKMSSINIE
jgi:hypothetical protein